MTIVLITITILSKVSRDMLCRDNYDDRSPGGGGGWGYSTNFYAGRPRPAVQPLTLTFYIPIFKKKVPLSYTFY